MTPEQQAAIVAVGDALRANPVPWDQVPDAQKQVVINLLRPMPSFTAEQRSFLNRWWLQVDDKKLAAINAKLPANTVVSPRIDVDGNEWISADLFTDAAEPGMRLHRILSELTALTLRHLSDDVWPVPDEEP